MKKILITGGSGQLGNCFSLMFNKKYNLLTLPKTEFDITNTEKIRTIIKEHNPEIIINCAAMTDVDGCEDNPILAENINVLAIRDILNIFKGLFIHISTDYVFDGKKGPYKEDDIPNPINVYGKTKYVGEEIVTHHSKQWVILRTNVLFDLASKASFVSWVVNSLRENKEIFVVNDQINNPIWINDFAKIIDLVIANDLRGLFHVGSDTLCSRYEFAKMIAEVFNLKKGKIYPISTESLDQNAKRPLKSGLIPNKLLSEIKLENIDLKKSLRELKNKCD